MKEQEDIVYIDQQEEQNSSELRFWETGMSGFQLFRKLRKMRHALRRLEYEVDGQVKDRIEKNYSKYAVMAICDRYAMDKDKIYKKLGYLEGVGGDRKKISVIIPCYNVASYIDRCMVSITVQTIGMEALEIICIDDASTDDTWVHLQKWEQMFPDNIVLIRQPMNRRQGAARNLGLQYASAEWIAFVDADDWLEPDYFEQLYAPTLKYDLDMVSCKVLRDGSWELTYFDEKIKMGKMRGQHIIVNEDPIVWFRNHLLDGGVSGKLICKHILLEFDIYFLEDLFYEDVYWSALLRFYVKRVYIVKSNLYHYFYNMDSTVLTRDEAPYLDYITVQLRRWEEYDRRGLVDKYSDAVEYDALSTAIWFMWSFMWKFDRPSFALYKLESEVIRQQVPNYKSHKYFTDFETVERILLDLLYLSLDRSGFLQIIDQVRKLYEDQEKSKRERTIGRGEEKKENEKS